MYNVLQGFLIVLTRTLMLEKRIKELEEKLRKND